MKNLILAVAAAALLPLAVQATDIDRYTGSLNVSGYSGNGSMSQSAVGGGLEASKPGVSSVSSSAANLSLTGNVSGGCGPCGLNGNVSGTFSGSTGGADIYISAVGHSGYAEYGAVGTAIQGYGVYGSLELTGRNNDDGVELDFNHNSSGADLSIVEID